MRQVLTKSLHDDDILRMIYCSTHIILFSSMPYHIFYFATQDTHQAFFTKASFVTQKLEELVTNGVVLLLSVVLW